MVLDCYYSRNVLWIENFKLLEPNLTEDNVTLKEKLNCSHGWFQLRKMYYDVFESLLTSLNVVFLFHIIHKWRKKKSIFTIVLAIDQETKKESGLQRNVVASRNGNRRFGGDRVVRRIQLRKREASHQPRPGWCGAVASPDLSSPSRCSPSWKVAGTMYVQMEPD